MVRHDVAKPEGPATEEIEVTPEMIEAGMVCLLYYDSRDTFPTEQRELVREIYRAMAVKASS